MSDKEVKLQESIFEFIQAENNYFQDLDAVNQHIVMPLMSSSEFPDASSFLESMHLSPLIRIATEHCSAFVKRLSKKQNERHDLIVKSIGQELISFYGSQSLITLYSQYAEASVFGHDFLAQERKKGSPIAKWIDVYLF